MEDIIIVGGGHVGLYGAANLAGAGYRVHLLDQKKRIGHPVVCTGIIGTEAFRKFSLPEETILGAIENVRFFSPKDVTLDYRPAKILAWIVDRTRFNRYFSDRAVSKGAKITTESRVTGLRVKKEGVAVRVSGPDGAETVLEAKVLILATGVNYKLFQWIGLQPPGNFLSGAQVHIPCEEKDWTHVYVGREVAPGSFGWMVPLTNGKARVGLLCEKSPAFYLKKLLNRIKPGWRDDVPEQAIELRPVIQGPVEKSFTDRVIVAGEAAGQIKTTTGGGIYYGLLGMQIAIETLHEAFRKNRFSAGVLSPYERRWKKAMGDELRLGQYCRKLFTKFSDRHIEDFFNHISKEEILNLARVKADFDWHKSLLLSVFKLPSIRRVFRQLF